MAQTPASNLPPVTATAFEADRQNFWHGWTNTVLASVIGILMFLVALLVVYSIGGFWGFAAVFLSIVGFVIAFLALTML